MGYLFTIFFGMKWLKGGVKMEGSSNPVRCQVMGDVDYDKSRRPICSIGRRQN